MQLSIRLAAVAEMAKGARRLADIGTDHGYVPIFLALEGKLEYAVAMDIHRGPLLRASEHIAEYGLEGRLETRLSDGASALLPGEADTVVIAGMGGPLTIKILSDGALTLSSVETFVLQPQSEIGDVRRFLIDHGYSITEENMVLDEGKYYPMMKAVHGISEKWEDFEYRYGKRLIDEKNPCLYEFLDREESNLRRILESLTSREGQHIRERERELRKNLEMLCRARESWRRGSRAGEPCE